MKPFKIIAEIGSTHDGNIKIAIKSIKAAAKAGADIIKFQMHIAEEETLKNAPNPPYFKKEKRFDYFKRTQFSFENWKTIMSECKKNKVEFLCSPFSIKAVEILEKLNTKAYKVASGEITNLPLLEVINKTKKFVFLSSGMSNYKELNNAINIFPKKNICLMQCSSIYPCPDELIGLNILDEYKKKYHSQLGFSDHSTDNIAAICFAASGAQYIEKHFTLSKSLYGSDAKNAMEPKEFSKYCYEIKKAWKLKNINFDKNDLRPFLKMKHIFEKSIVAKHEIPKSHTIKHEDLIFLKPGDGIRADNYKKVVGSKTTRKIKKNSKLRVSDLKFKN